MKDILYKHKYHSAVAKTGFFITEARLTDCLVVPPRMTTLPPAPPNGFTTELALIGSSACWLVVLAYWLIFTNSARKSIMIYCI
jgi:hypothetical protein